jgi:hypothetical protein
MNRRSRGWLSPRDDNDTELDALLAEAWDDGAAAARKVLDLQAGKAALLAACGQQQAAGTAASASPGTTTTTTTSSGGGGRPARSLLPELLPRWPPGP